MTGRESPAEGERDGYGIAQLEQNKTALCDAAPIKAAPRRRFKAAQGGELEHRWHDWIETPIYYSDILVTL